MRVGAALVGLLVFAAVVYAVLLGPGRGVVTGLSPSSSPAAVASSSQTPDATPRRIVGTGLVTFGLNFDPTSHQITGATSRFRTSQKSIAWNASLSEPAGARKLALTIASRSTSGAEKILARESVDIADPSATSLSFKTDLASQIDRKPGTYVMRYLRGEKVLAEGTFTLVK